MNPIPLSAPDGRVYAYACSRCHHVPASGSMLCRDEAAGPIEQLVEGMRWKAESCCTCAGCGVAMDLGRWSRSRCDACGLWEDWSRVWMRIGIAIENGLKTAEDWAQWLDGDEEDDDD